MTSVLNDQRDPLPGTRRTSASSRTLPRHIAIFTGRQEVPVHRAVQRVRLLRRPGGLQDICGRLGPADIQAFFDRWAAIMPTPRTQADGKSIGAR